MLDTSPFDNITKSPVHILAALRKSLLKIRHRAARDIFSGPLFSSTVNVLDCRVIPIYWEDVQGASLCSVYLVSKIPVLGSRK